MFTVSVCAISSSGPLLARALEPRDQVGPVRLDGEGLGGDALLLEHLPEVVDHRLLDARAAWSAGRSSRSARSPGSASGSRRRRPSSRCRRAPGPQAPRGRRRRPSMSSDGLRMRGMVARHISAVGGRSTTKTVCDYDRIVGAVAEPSRSRLRAVRRNRSTARAGSALAPSALRVMSTVTQGRRGLSQVRRAGGLLRLAPHGVARTGVARRRVPRQRRRRRPAA